MKPAFHLASKDQIEALQQVLGSGEEVTLRQAHAHLEATLQRSISKQWLRTEIDAWLRQNHSKSDEGAKSSEYPIHSDLTTCHAIPSHPIPPRPTPPTPYPIPSDQTRPIPFRHDPTRSDSTRPSSPHPIPSLPIPSHPNPSHRGSGHMPKPRCGPPVPKPCCEQAHHP